MAILEEPVLPKDKELPALEKQPDAKMEDLDDEVTDSLLLKSGIPRPTSRPNSRPLSRPTPSARVRALGKGELDEVDPHSPEDEEEEDDEEDDEEEQGIQVEGRLFHARSALAHKMHKHVRPPSPILTYSLLEHDINEARRKGDKQLHFHNSLYSDTSLSDCSIEDEILYNLDYSVENERDLCYLDMPYSAKSAYDPADFEHLSASNDMKELFQYITRYTPQTIELDHKLRPFVPEYIPAVGDIDAFIKVPRPDGEQDKLGLVALDEPCAKQSDPAVLDLQLRAITKETTSKAVAVKKLENGDKQPKEIEAWINSIANLHQSKPPPTVHYARNMPEIDMLMQEWPPEFEQSLQEVGLPTADLDCTLEEYVDIVCGLLDIPVYKSRIQSLHLLFTLYMDFKNSQHFRSMAANEGCEDEDDDE